MLSSTQGPIFSQLKTLRPKIGNWKALRIKSLRLDIAKGKPAEACGILQPLHFIGAGLHELMT